MPPIIIADSDDEDNDYSQPHGVQADTLFGGVGQDHPDLLGGVSHSTSTDPSFFQNIYDEQNYATQENTPREFPGTMTRDGISSSEMTAPAPFQRIVTGLAHPSSLTSISTPNQAAPQAAPQASGGNGIHEWTQGSTPGRKKAPTAVMGDPWDVPSSPEVGQSRTVSKIRLKQPAFGDAKRQGTGAGGQAAVPLDMFDVVGHGGPNGQASPERKRRRVESSYPTQQSTDEVDLVTLPFSFEPGDTQTSMLPPTLPMDRNASFFISTRPLTEAQRLEYQSVNAPSSEGHLDILPPINQQDVLPMLSSGTATNVNTQRSDRIGSAATPLPSATPGVVREPPRQSAHQRIPSSPDIISAVESPPKPKRKKQREKPVHDLSRTSHENEKPGQQEPIDQAAAATVDTDAQEKEAEPIPEPVKPKKSRGRPRKKDTEEQVQTPTKQPELGSADAGVSTKQKKKRGRPRKQDKQTEVEESPSRATNPLDDDKPAAHITKADTVIPSEDQPEGVNSKDIADSVLLAAKDKHDAVLKETSPNPVAQHDSETPKKNEKSESPDASEIGMKEKPVTPVPKSATKSRGLSELTAMAKPVYRVGLSKRSRIAPLLKSIRK